MPLGILRVQIERDSYLDFDSRATALKIPFSEARSPSLTIRIVLRFSNATRVVRKLSLSTELPNERKREANVKIWAAVWKCVKQSVEHLSLYPYALLTFLVYQIFTIIHALQIYLFSIESVANSYPNIVLLITIQTILRNRDVKLLNTRSSIRRYKGKKVLSRKESTLTRVTRAVAQHRWRARNEDKSINF